MALVLFFLVAFFNRRLRNSYIWDLLADRFYEVTGSSSQALGGIGTEFLPTKRSFFDPIFTPLTFNGPLLALEGKS